MRKSIAYMFQNPNVRRYIRIKFPQFRFHILKFNIRKSRTWGILDIFPNLIEKMYYFHISSGRLNFDTFYLVVLDIFMFVFPTESHRTGKFTLAIFILRFWCELDCFICFPILNKYVLGCDLLKHFLRFICSVCCME